MPRNWFVITVAAFMVGCPVTTRVHALPSPADPGAYGQQYDWDVAPQDYNNAQQLGFHHGVAGAKKDFSAGLNPDPNRHPSYTDANAMPPEIPRSLFNVWRQAFRRGYDTGVSHLWQSQTQAPAWDQWGMRGLKSEVERQGYHDGARLAHDDYEHGRRPDPDGHSGYQNPPVGRPLWDEYRGGFLRGYTVTSTQLSGEIRWENYTGDPSRWQAPNAYSEWKRRGFHDGIDGARKDYGNGRPPNPNNRDEYRSPHAPDQFRWEYREGFRRGYEIAVARLYNM